MIPQTAAVYILDNDEDVRDMLTRLVRSLGYHPELFWDAKSLLAAPTPEHCACVIVDAWLPGMSGLDILRELRGRGLDVPVVMTSGYPDVTLAVDAMKIGAYDFIEKPLSFQRMREAIQGAIELDENQRESRRRVGGMRERLEGLSKREYEVLEQVAAGLGSSEIAVRLGIQTKTVEVHRSHINKKMKARNTADLVRMFHCIQTDVGALVDRQTV